MDIGRIWNQDYEEQGVKNYEDSNFRIVEEIYADARDMAANLLDLSNIAERLKDFIGRQNLRVKKIFRLELSHKIALSALGVAIVVLLFGNNIIGRWLDNETKTASINTDSLKGKAKKDYRGNYITNDTSSDKSVSTKIQSKIPCSNDSIKFIPLKDNEPIKVIYHGISITLKKVIGNHSPFRSAIQPYYISDPLPYSLMIDYCSHKPCSSPVPNQNTLKNDLINSICVEDAQGIASLLCMQIPTNNLLMNADAAGVITIDYQHLEIYASPTGEELFSMVKHDSLPNFSFTTAFDTIRRQYRFPGMEPDFKCGKGRFRLIKIIK